MSTKQPLQNGRTLPHSLEAEQYLLSICLIEETGTDVLAKAVEANVGATAFYFPAHRIVFSRLLDMRGRHLPIDVPTLAEELKTFGELDEVGGFAYITQISGLVPTTAQAEYFIGKVRDLALLREIIRTAQSVGEECYGFSGKIEDFVAKLSTKFADVVQKANRTDWPDTVTAAHLCETPPPTPPLLVEGILYRGGTMMLSGPSKSHKTYTMMDAACAIASGRPWLGFKTVATPVIYVNLELPDFAASERIKRICAASGDTPPATLELWNLRGRRVSLDELKARLHHKIKRTGAGLVIIDPHYKVSAVSGAEENSNDSQGLLLSELETICNLNGAALIIAHHFAKGDASGKNALDRASGGGVLARWGDAIVTFTPHEEDDAMTVEMALRVFAPVDPFAVRWNHPLWCVDRKLDPSKLKKVGRSKEHTPEEALTALGDDMLMFSEWKKRAGKSDSTMRRLAHELLSSGKVEKIGLTYRRPPKSPESPELHMAA